VKKTQVLRAQSTAPVSHTTRVALRAPPLQQLSRQYLSGAVIAFSAPALADEGNDESGKGWYGQDRGDWRGYGGDHYDEKGKRYGGYDREDWLWASWR